MKSPLTITTIAAAAGAVLVQSAVLPKLPAQDHLVARALMQPAEGILDTASHMGETHVEALPNTLPDTAGLDLQRVLDAGSPVHADTTHSSSGAGSSGDTTTGSAALHLTVFGKPGKVGTAHTPLDLSRQARSLKLKDDWNKVRRARLELPSTREAKQSGGQSRYGKGHEGQDKLAQPEEKHRPALDLAAKQDERDQQLKPLQAELAHFDRLAKAQEALIQQADSELQHEKNYRGGLSSFFLPKNSYQTEVKQLRDGHQTQLDMYLKKSSEVQAKIDDIKSSYEAERALGSGKATMS